MKLKKYLLVPGYVKSQYDDDMHYISPVQLKNLYGVPMNECLIHSPRSMRGSADLIELTPQSNGDYTLPKDNNAI